MPDGLWLTVILAASSWAAVAALVAYDSWRRQYPDCVQQQKATAREDGERHEHQDHIEVVLALDRMTYEHEARRHQERRYEDKKARRERVTIFGIFAAAFVALLQSGLFYCSMRDAREFAKTQHDDTALLLQKAESANIQATKAANAATAQASIAGERERSELRAYVYTVTDHQLPSFEPGAVNYFSATFSNDGETPAYVESDRLLWGVVSLPWSTPPDQFPTDMAPYDTAAIVKYVYKGHSDSIKSNKALVINNEQSVALKEGKAAVAFYGQMVYRDVFGCRHFADFCAVYIKGVDVPETEIDCVTHNGVDTAKECRKD